MSLCTTTKLDDSITFGNHIIKQWITHNNLFEQHYHATVLSYFSIYENKDLLNNRSNPLTYMMMTNNCQKKTTKI